MPVHLLGGRRIIKQKKKSRVVERIPEPPGSRSLEDFVEEGVVDALVDEDPLRRAAHLSRAEEAAEDGALGGAFEVGVLADDNRAVAARLDQRALQTCCADDLLG